MIVKGLREILDLLFPKVCLLCRSPAGDENATWICGQCKDDLTPILNACPRCGAPLGEPALVSYSRQASNRKSSNCGFCKGQKWDFGRAWSYTIYHSTASRAVRLMKESHGEPLTRSIGDLLAQWLQSQESFKPEAYDTIVPIPQHWFRRLTQRYNQATTLGERVSHHLKMRCTESILRRTRWTQKQGMKTISERRENLLEAFEVTNPTGVKYRSFLLIDDVMTSGATLQEAARALRAAGARRIDAVVFARGVNAPKLPGNAKSRMAAKEDLTFDQNISDSQSLISEHLRRKIH
jgi:ComF family protein